MDSRQMNKKAVVLLSGGLDSILATKIMMELGIEVVCAHYYIEFAACAGGGGGALKSAKALGVECKVFDITEEYLEMFKKPKHGYGANINPCIDCKIFMLKKARIYMDEVGASFLVTGEVLGERPMSQRKDALNIIEKNAGVRGILLRPLSAKCLTPTLPETEGVVDRDKLFGITGRSRKAQMELAKKYGIIQYPNPSGGCLLTDPGFAKRVRDLFKYNDVTTESLGLLKLGRHFRLSDQTKLIVGRDDKENSILERLVKDGDVLFLLKDREGPFSILRGPSDNDMIRHSAEIIAHHTKFRAENSIPVIFWRAPSNIKTDLDVHAASIEDVSKFRV